jgi:hypothetical protein
LYPVNLESITLVDNCRWDCGAVAADGDKHSDVLSVPASLLVLGLLVTGTDNAFSLSNALLESGFVCPINELIYDSVTTAIPLNNPLQEVKILGLGCWIDCADKPVIGPWLDTRNFACF